VYAPDVSASDVAAPPDLTAALHAPSAPDTAAVPSPLNPPQAVPAANPAAAVEPVPPALTGVGEPPASELGAVRAVDQQPPDLLRDAIAPDDLLPTTLMPDPDPTPEPPEATQEPTPAAGSVPSDAEPGTEPADPADEAILAAIRWRLDGATLREVVDDRDELRELGVRLDRPLSASDDNVSRARLLCLRAEVYRLLDELGMAAAASRLALAHAEAARDPYAVVVAQGELAHVLRLRGDFAEADRLFEQAASAEVPELLRCVIHENAGRCCFDQGRYMEALDHFARAIRLGDPLDLELVERIDVALEAVYIRVLRDGWGPYPRLRREIMAAAPGPDRHPAPRAGTVPQRVPAGTAPANPVMDGAAGPAQGRPAQGEPAQGEPAQGEPAQGEPAQGEPAQGEPAQGEPAQGEPAQGELAGFDAAAPVGTEGLAAASTDAAPGPGTGAAPPTPVPAQAQRTAEPEPVLVHTSSAAVAPAAATSAPVAAPAAAAPPETNAGAPARRNATAPGSWFTTRS
jgi:hypothetical protein